LGEGIQVYSNEGWLPSLRGDNSKRVNIYKKYLKIFSRTTGPVSTRLGTNHPWGEGIQVCSNEGWLPSLRRDNSKRGKIYKKYLKIFSSRTTGPISTRLGTNYPWGEDIQVCSNEGRHHPLRGDNSKRVKTHKKIYENLLQNHRANFNQTWHKSSFGRGDSSLFK
jgi:hypothetical protein